MIHIVYIIHALYSPSGLERVLTQKVNWLAATGRYDITIITSRQRGLKPAFELDPRVRLTDIGVNFYSLLGTPVFRFRLRRLLDRLKPDIIDSACSPKLGYLPDLRCPGRKIAEFHFSHFSLFTDDCDRRTALRFQRQVKGFDRFVVLTRDDERDWEPYTGKISRICNPCTLSGQADLQSRGVALIGRLVPQKNVADAVKAWKSVAERHPDWTLNVYGEGKQRPALEQLISDSGLNGKIILHGIVDNIHEKICRNSIMMMSSLYEGFPLSLIEGSALGMPLVSYDCKCGPAEIIEDGGNGYLVPQGDTKALAERICTLIEDPDLRGKMGRISKELSERFRMEPIMRQWDDLFTELATGK